jgi:hypothetical protein
MDKNIMATLYPIAIDDNTTLPNPTGILAMNATPITHSMLHDDVNDAIKAIQTKVGLGASSPSGNGLFYSNVANQTGWGNLAGDVTSLGLATTLANTNVVPGTYTSANITVNSKGLITAAANGSGGGGGGSSSPLTNRGDIWVYSSLDTRLPIGADTQILIADSTQATGMKWGSAPATGVTTISVATANGFAGTVATPTTTPVITIKTSVTGLLKGNATAISAATAGTDYSIGTSGLGTGILKSTTGTGALTIAVAADFPTLNQSTTGNAATATLATTVTTNANLTGDVTSIGNATTYNSNMPVAKGGTGATAITGTGNNVLSISPALTGSPTTPTQTANDNSTKIASTAYVDAKAGTQSIIDGEVPAGTINGSNVTFTLASTPATNSLALYKNGIRLKAGGADYTLSGATITFVTAPPTGAVLLADYNVSSTSFSVGTNSTITDEVPAGTVNGSTVIFTAARGYIAGSLEVFINGVKQARTTHFTETTPSTGVFTMSDAPLTGDNIIINYLFNLNPSSNSDTVDGIHASTTPVANQLVALDSNARMPLSTQPFALAVTAYAGANETTTTTTYVDLATTTDTVTTTVGASGMVTVHLISAMANSTTGFSFTGFAISGANTLAASDPYSIESNGSSNYTQFGATFLMTGLTPGSTTFKMKYRTSAGTSNFVYRRIAVIPL